jgi:outer membrane protein insertion porin family
MVRALGGIQSYFRALIVLFAVFPGSFLFATSPALSQKKQIVAVLPFEVYASEPMTHLKLGLQEMINTRLASRGLEPLNPKLVNARPLANLPELTTIQAIALGKGIKADWIIFGSLTQIGEKISLDVSLIDVSEREPPSSLFIVADDIDDLSDVVDQAAASLYNLILKVPQIDEIKVTGNKRIEKEAILAMVDSKKGGSLDQEKLDKDLRAIFQMGFFKEVLIDIKDGPKGKVVIFSVVEKPAIAKITFEGNNNIKDDDLTKELGIRLYAILNQNEIKRSINRLKDLYLQKGYYSVKIEEEIAELPKNEVSLTYHITEGKKIYIRKIEFTGNEHFSDRKLRSAMVTHTKGLLSFFTKSGLLDKKALEFDRFNITSFYHNHGYIKAKVSDPQIDYSEKGITITFDVIEGDQYAVNEVKVSGDLIQPEDKLIKSLKITKEKYLNREVLRKDTLQLKSVYADVGFAYAEIAPLVQEDHEKHLANIDFKISKGEKVRFERINITGNTITRDKVIRRELKTVEGDEYSETNLRKNSENLNRLGYFENVEVNTKKGSSDDLMILDINVEEKPTGSFSIGAGYSSFESIIGTISVKQENLFGRGQKLEGTVTLGGRTRDYVVRFTEPWLFDTHISTSVNVYDTAIEWYEYTKDSLGMGLSFGYPVPFSEYTRVTTGYQYDDADIADVDDNASIIIKDMEGQNITSSIILGITRNSRDRPFLTRKGSENRFFIEYAGGILGGTVAFDRYLATSTWFFPLPLETVIVLRGDWGYIRGRPEDGNLPMYQLFRAGGPFSVRGYETGTISPQDPLTGDYIGGEKKMIYNAEFHFPLVKAQGVEGVLFFDAGNVFLESETVTFKDIPSSYGLGVRWYSPVGPLRLEYGWKVNPQPGESSGEWIFTVGRGF